MEDLERNSQCGSIAINQRLKIFIDTLEISKTKFAGSIGVTRQQLSNWINLDVKIPIERLAVIAREYPDLDLKWLLTGEYAKLTVEGNSYILTKEQMSVLLERKQMTLNFLSGLVLTCNALSRKIRDAKGIDYRLPTEMTLKK